MTEVEAQMSEQTENTQEETSMEAPNGDGTDGSNGNTATSPAVTDAEDRKLFCGGLSFDTVEADLKTHFEKFGEIQACTVKIDPMTKKSRGFGFITFGTKQALEDAIAAAPHTIKGKQIDPKAAKARPGAKKVFCGGLPPETSEEEIRTYFGQYGNIESLELPMDKEKNQRRGFIFITYETVAGADNAVKKPKQTINGKECDVKKATPKSDSYRGGWGGYGMRGGRGGRGGGGRGGRGYNQGWGGYGGYDAYGYGGYGYDGGYGYGGGWGPQSYGGTNWQQGGSYGKQGRGGRSAGYHPYR